jgi:hypothetical protein
VLCGYVSHFGTRRRKALSYRLGTSEIGRHRAKSTLQVIQIHDFSINEAHREGSLLAIAVVTKKK